MSDPKALGTPSHYLEGGKNGENFRKRKRSKTGRFIPVKEAERRKNTAVVEKIKVGPIKHRK